MERKTSDRKAAGDARDVRLKTALKANLAKRKAQARARSDMDKAAADDAANNEQS